MKSEQTGASQQLDRLFRLGTVAGATDSQLVEQFVTGDDESAALAFKAIVERHGSMVLRVCRLVLRDAHAAEDAFQATFLVLARRARTLGSRELLCNWLYGVAARTARKARATAMRQQVRDRAVAYHRPVATFEPSLDESQRDLEQVLHEEIDRLPRPYRTAVVICYLEGMSQAQAARQLQLAESTVRGRLARARTMLSQRLTRRGVGFSTGLLALDATANASAQHLPGATTRATARAALLFVKRGTVMQGAVISTTAQSIANGVVSTMWFSTLKSAAAMVMAVCLVAGGAALLAQPVVEPQRGGKPTQAADAPKIAVVLNEAGQGASPQELRVEQKKGHEQSSEKEESVAVEKDLAKLAPGPIFRAIPVSKDCMILAYMPDWNFGNVDNIGIGNNDGGVRTLIDWPAIPADEANRPDRRFLIALYSRKTTSHPPTSKIYAFEILEKWPERTSWTTQPKYDVEPAATYKFEPNEGWKLFDITPLVRAQARTGHDGHGVILRFLREDVAGGSRVIHSDYELVSREGADKWASRRPVVLVVKALKE